MSAENSTTENIPSISDNPDGATESTAAIEAKKPNTPLSYEEKLCLNVSITAIALAVLNSAGLLNDLPTFLPIAVKEQPFNTFFAMLCVSVLAAVILSNIMPKHVRVLAHLPIFAFAAFWGNIAWNYLIEERGPTVTGTSVIWVMIACLILGFCFAYHEQGTEKGKPTLSVRIEVFIWTAIVANVIAFFAVFLISAVFVGNVKESIQSKIDSEIEVHKRLDYIFGACPMVESKEYCDALKVVTSRQ